MRIPRPRPARYLRSAVLCAVLAAGLLAAGASSETQANAYTIYTTEGRRTLPFRTAGRADVVMLDQLAAIFKITITEDPLVGGLTLRGAGQTILLIPGQSFASIGPGRVVSLPAPLQRDRADNWEVPVEFIRQALGPALGVNVEVRREKRVILVGDVRLPQITGRVEAQGSGRRVVLDVQPPAPHAVTRAGNRLTVRFDAVALDFTPIQDLPQDFVTSVRVEGVSLVFALGASAATHRVEEPAPNRVAIDLLPPAPPPMVAGTAKPSPDPPVLDLAPAGSLRSVVIDPGHGGDDTGARGPGETTEKDLVMRLARRLKATIEGRLGLRVLLTRDGDDDVPLDRRASVANNNKADLFISLHTNASVRPSVSGIQVLSLRLDDYRHQVHAAESAPLPVPIVGGGSRIIDVVPWDIAQLPFVQKSAVVAAILQQRLQQQGLPMFSGPVARMPLRTLVGANMPAVMIEIGFLSNPHDAQALTQAERSTKIVDAIVGTLSDIRSGIPGAPAAGPAPAAQATAAPAR